MLAFGLSLAIFFYFLLVGSPVVRALHASRSRVQDLLISPVLGIGVTLIPIFTLSRLGLPVGRFGPWLTPILPVLAIVAHLLMNRRHRHGQLGETSPAGIESWPHALLRYLPFLAVLMGAAVLTGRPLRDYGFDWLSFCNDDMANYTLSADRFLRNGFFDTPDPWVLVRGSDYAQSFWYVQVVMMVRSGCDLLLAWVISVAGRSGHEIFMPLIVAFHVCLVSTAAAMVCVGRRVDLGARRVSEGQSGGTFLADAPGSHASLSHASGSQASRTYASGDADRYWPALVTAILVACSAELTFGTVYQLIAQASGLAILGLNVLLLCRPFDGLPRSQLLRHATLVAIVLTTQFLVYPEVNPFLAATFFFYLAGRIVQAAPIQISTRNPFKLLRVSIVGTFRRLRILRGLGTVLVAGAVVTLILLNRYVYDALVFMLNQREQAAHMDDPSRTLFPFFLLPSGLANFWGFVQINDTDITAGWLSVYILAGGLLMLLAIGATLRLAWRGEPAALLTAVCMLLAAGLFAANVGFGLYKLAMFAQPFIWGTVAVAFWRLLRRVRLRHAQVAFVLILLVAWPSFQTQRRYVNHSMGAGRTFNEIVGATNEHLIRDIQRVALAGDPTKPILFDTYNLSLAKLIALYTYGRPAAFPSSRLTELSALPESAPVLSPEKYKREAEKVRAITHQFRHTTAFEYEPEHPGKQWDYFLSFDICRPLEKEDPDDTVLVVTTRRLNLLNHRGSEQWAGGSGQEKPQTSPTGSASTQPKSPIRNPKSKIDPSTHSQFIVTTVGQIHNHLLYRESSMSQPYYSIGDPKDISLYQVEEDPLFYPGEPMAGIGRHLLFEVLRPSKQVRFVVELSASLRSDGDNSLPSAAMAVGTARAAIPFVGRGSARIFSDPITPQYIHGRPHVGIDMGQWGTQFQLQRAGAMKLYGRKVQLDRRLLIGFGRDISLVGADEYEKLDPPSAISHFADTTLPNTERLSSELRNKDLEYSGIYEDGYVAERSFVSLGRPKASGTPATRDSAAADGVTGAAAAQPPERLVIRGLVPGIAGQSGFAPSLTLKVDGKMVRFQSLQQSRPPAGQPTQPAESETFGMGTFSLTADLPPVAGPRRRVELEWSAAAKLGDPDNRPVAAQLKYIGIEAGKR